MYYARLGKFKIVAFTSVGAKAIPLIRTHWSPYSSVNGINHLGTKYTASLCPFHSHLCPILASRSGVFGAHMNCVSVIFCARNIFQNMFRFMSSLIPPATANVIKNETYK